MTTPRKQPWDQRDDEPNTAYAHFCVFRDLGVERTLDKAYRIWMPNRAGSAAKRRRSGQWSIESREFHWIERALAYDLHIFQTDARDIALAAVRYLRTLALKGLAELNRSIRPGSDAWSSHLDTVALILDRIPHETIAALLQPDAPGPENRLGVNGRGGPIPR